MSVSTCWGGIGETDVATRADVAARTLLQTALAYFPPRALPTRISPQRQTRGSRVMFNLRSLDLNLLTVLARPDHPITGSRAAFIFATARA